jgi:Reverse transcriptase (RNA-dependent DNA polymerase)/RNase H-like domain found in reverse transcriptase/Integrase zinc binding domain
MQTALDPLNPHQPLPVMTDQSRVEMGRAVPQSSSSEADHPVVTPSSLTFLFAVQVHSQSACLLIDSGARGNHVSLSFVQQHHIPTVHKPYTYCLGDGTSITASHQATVSIQLDAYTEKVVFSVSQLPQGLDFLLGDAWALEKGLCLDWGNTTTPGVYVPPHAWIRSHNLRIVPNLHESDLTTPIQSCLMTAMKTRQVLHDNPEAMHRAFMVLVTDEQDTCPPTPSDIPPEAKAQLAALLEEFKDVFEDSPEVAPFRDGTPECIRLPPEAKATNRPSFRLSLKERQEVERAVKELLDAGRIEPSSSSFGAPVLFAPKPDGTLRMCIDYRALNEQTIKNKYPLPRIDDLLDNLQGAQYFSSLDLACGYWQITLRESDRPKTAMNTHIGKYQWRVMPFGLTNAPSIFQAVMNNLFHERLNKGVGVYLDDLVIYSKVLPEHFKLLRWVFEKLRESKFKAKWKKCKFLEAQLKFLGHIVSREGLAPDPAKVKTVVDWPGPQSRYEVRSFLGLANYFRRYIRDYAKLARPLNALLKGFSAADKRGQLLQRGKLSPAAAEAIRAEFRTVWTPKCSHAFHKLKEALLTAPVLALPDFDKEFTLVCDACETAPAIGAVLLQEGRPVAFYSKQLTVPEAQYSASDMEMLAVIYPLREFRPYLEGNRFVIETDHLPNTYLHTSTNPHTLRRRARWLLETGAYDFEHRYKPGVQNVADPLSRAPQHFRAADLHSDTVSTPSKGGVALLLVAVDTPPAAEDGPDRTFMAFAKAPHSGAWRGFSLIGGFPADELLQRVHASTSTLSDEDKETLVSNHNLSRDQHGLLWTKQIQLLVPDAPNLRSDIIHSTHATILGGHYGVTRTVKKLKENFFWPKMHEDVVHHLKHCESCLRNKVSTQKPQGEYQPLEIPQRRWDSVSMDLITHLPESKNGNDSVVVFVDRLSKMVHLAACKEAIGGEGLAMLFQDKVMRLHGVPQEIVSDRDIRFGHHFWVHLFEELKVKHSKSSPMHPQSDGQTEMANRILEDTLRHFVGPQWNDWEELLPMVEFAMNNAYNDAIQTTPFMLNAGQHPNLPLLNELRKYKPEVNRFIGRWSEKLKEAKKCIAAAQDRYKAKADRRRRVTDIKPGDQVVIDIKHFKKQIPTDKKLGPKYIGPFWVTQTIGKNNSAFKVHLVPPFQGMHSVFHVSSLKRFQTEGSYSLPNVSNLETMDWRIESVLATRTIQSNVGPRRQYLVRWTGGGESWHDAMLLSNCVQHIRAYWASVLNGESMPRDALPLTTEELASLLGGAQSSGGEQ